MPRVLVITITTCLGLAIAAAVMTGAWPSFPNANQGSCDSPISVRLSCGGDQT